MRTRDAALAATVALLVSLIFSIPYLDRLDGLSLDSLFWLRHKAFGRLHAPRDSPVAVIAIDEETYRRPPFRDLPRVMWTGQLARVVDSVIAGGARVIGFDLILPTSVEKYVRGFDRDFLISLRRNSEQGKLVLGKVQHQTKPISPHRSQSFAVGHQKNIRSVNVFEDGDGVIRSVPLIFEAQDLRTGTRRESSMALELAIRALGGSRPIIQDGRVVLGDYVIPGSEELRMTLNFDGGPGAIPTYSFADLFACTQLGSTDYFRRQFAGKVVLIGTVLDVEDRKLTSIRFIGEREGIGLPERCAVPVMKGLYRQDLARDSIPGVYIHATAVANLLRGEALNDLSRVTDTIISLLFALVAAFTAMAVAQLRAGMMFAGLTVVWIIAVTAVFRAGTVLPLFDPLVSGVIAFGVMLGFRLAFSDKDKRYLRKVFSYYLPNSVIERMVAGDELPTLGGESREITIFFSDIAGFTTLSEGLNATQVTEFLNEYLTEMSDIIEDHGGFIEKFVADEITGVFGAPMYDEDHAVNAVLAAMECNKRLRDVTGSYGFPQKQRITARFGINTGEMLVGNIGSKRRFNYAAIGDAANLGSRLEGANKFYGTSILVGERSVELCDGAIEFREIDRVRVVGRTTPVTIFEPLAEVGALNDSQRRLRDNYASALAVYRAEKFDEAVSAFDALAQEDTVSRIIAKRALDFARNQPLGNWDGVFDLESK